MKRAGEPQTKSRRATVTNEHPATVAGFGQEWTAFDQSQLPDADRRDVFADYFRHFPWDQLPVDAVGADIGCGSGRWARMVAARVGRLHLLDASAEALAVARRNLAGHDNCEFHHATVGELPFAASSLDFAYSLGVLHHVPDTREALKAILLTLKPGAPFLVYLYYRFDNRPVWFRLLWRMSDLLRRVVSRLPLTAKKSVTGFVAVGVYWPLSRAARLLERGGRLPDAWPLAIYRDRSFYTLRTDAFDRFATRLEQRFTRAEIDEMLRSAGFEDLAFSEEPPFWCVLARRPSAP